MESFWLAETLKYTYMLQLDTADSIDLEKYVMNTVSNIIRVQTGSVRHARSSPLLGHAVLPCRSSAFVVGWCER